MNCLFNKNRMKFFLLSLITLLYVNETFCFPISEKNSVDSIHKIIKEKSKSLGIQKYSSDSTISLTILKKFDTTILYCDSINANIKKISSKDDISYFSILFYIMDKLLGPILIGILTFIITKMIVRYYTNKPLRHKKGGYFRKLFRNRHNERED